jgi:hypothetical protein
VDGVSAFSIGVTDTFDGTTLNTGGLTACTTFEGYPRHGDFDNVFHCDSVVTGRYVAVYSNYANNNPYKICDLAVRASRRECMRRVQGWLGKGLKGVEGRLKMVIEEEGDGEGQGSGREMGEVEWWGWNGERKG